MKQLLCVLCLLCIMTGNLFPIDGEQTILILPFSNTGKENKYLPDTIFISYLYVYFAQLDNFAPIHPYKILSYMEKNLYRTGDLYNIEILNAMMQTFQCQLILGGEYKVENEMLKVDIDIYGKQRIKKYFEVKIESDEKEALSSIAQQTARAFSGYNPDTACLTVHTDYPCSLYLDDVYFGVTPNRFTLPAGVFELKIVYKDDNFEENVFSKTITLVKGQVLDLGKIPVCVTYEIKANVESGIYCDGKRVGVTDLLLQLPLGHEFDLEIVYTDGQNERRLKKDVISTKDGKDGRREFEFSNRIKVLCGNLPFSVKIADEKYAKGPYIFDNLGIGTHNIQIILEDPQWNKEWIIHKEKVTLNIAETAVIDKSDFIYHRNWGLCFIPGAAQFHNFEPVKGTIILSISTLTIAGSIISYYLMENNMKNFDKFNIFRVVSWSSLGLFCTVYIYSTIDGFVIMSHLSKLFYSQ